MSIQINGIDKPKSCFDCPCIDAEFEECAAREHYLLPKDEYGAVLGDVPDWCPITEPPTCDDAVSRQAAIVKLQNNLAYMRAFGCDRSIVLINELPAVQPQITHCAECIHWKHSDVRKSYCEVFDWVNTADDFCSFAERRTDEQNS